MCMYIYIYYIYCKHLNKYLYMNASICVRVHRLIHSFLYVDHKGINSRSISVVSQLTSGGNAASAGCRRKKLSSPNPFLPPKIRTSKIYMVLSKGLIFTIYLKFPLSSWTFSRTAAPSELHHSTTCLGLYSFTGPRTSSMHCGRRTFTSSLIRPKEVMVSSRGIADPALSQGVHRPPECSND